MVQIDVEYLGDLHCKVIHTPSGQSFITDAPIDNQGKGEFISPTDLTAASIASCIATIMSIKARNSGFDIEGLKISAQKFMINEPVRHIGKINLEIFLPHIYNEKEMAVLKNVVKTCPVSRSLAPDVEIITNFIGPEA
ncbi:MAG: OsmC family protein [Candidatus Kapaibacterium sp.]|jgi:putative redox protein|nr:OsmC family protein [Candidatus Kapabacteria bacterium]